MKKGRDNLLILTLALSLYSAVAVSYILIDSGLSEVAESHAEACKNQSLMSELECMSQ